MDLFTVEFNWLPRSAWEPKNAKYGEGNWNTGATTEYNKIVKWCQRSLK